MELQTLPEPATRAAAEPAPTPRRRFLGGTLTAVIGGALAAALPAAHARAKPAPRRLHLQDCRIAGSHYYDCESVMPRQRGGDPRSVCTAHDRPHLHVGDPRSVCTAHDGLRLRVGDAVQLHRQPDNRHDGRAIEVFWRGHKLGYLPRLDNAAAASLADRAHTLHAAVIAIDDPAEHWEPICLRLWVTPA